MLMAQICEGNKILNYDKTKCIPVPGFLMPFPLVLIALIGTTLIIRDKRKNPNSRFYPNMVVLLSVLETIGLLFMTGMTKSYGIKPAYSLSALALGFMIGLNLFFTLIYAK